MSEAETGAFYMSQIRDLQRQLTEANAEAKKRRLQFKTTSKELAEIKAEREQLARERESLKASPSEWQAKAEKLQSELRTRDHREAWLKVVGENLADKVPLEEVWSKIQYTVGENIPSESEIKSQVKAARDVAPYLFREGSEPRTPAPAGAQPPSKAPSHVPFEASRGDRDTGNHRFVVRQSDMQNGGWMMANSRAIAEASKKGILDIIPG